MAGSLETEVERYYSTSGLTARILDALKTSGVDIGKLRIADLAPVDELHVGGRPATEHAMSRLRLLAGQHVLDVGSGLGGAARYVVEKFGCRVTGIDLTPDFVEAARTLTRMVGLSERVDFQAGSALAMPFADGTFDAATTLHVAMNIQDRPGLYREVARVLKPGAPFLVYDVMKGEGDGPRFPVPWATSPETSHLETPDAMRKLLEEAGFTIEEVEDRTAFGIEFFRQRLASGSSAPPVGVLLFGPDMRQRFLNLLEAMETGAVAPVVMVARRK
ncbi:MAG: class I SAM-dependent methyltransferase [Parvibaculaceae bacterium]